MKNIIALVMFIQAALATTSFLFAQSPFTITVDGAVDALYMRTYLGDYADRDNTSSYKYQGNGITNVFQSSMFTPGIKGRVVIAYAGEKLGGSMELRMTTDSEYSAMADWDAWFSLGPWADFIGIRVLGGNTVQNGRISTYDTFNDTLKANIENLGIMVPVWRINGDSVANIETISKFPYGYEKTDLGSNLYYAQFYGTESYDLFMPTGSNIRRDLNLLADIILTPITVSFAIGGLFESDSIPTKDIFEIEGDGGARIVLHDSLYDPASTGGINFAFRVESARIADLLTVAAVYKHNSSFKQKVFDTNDISMNTYALADVKKSNHGYGVYAGLTPLDSLGISIGYSGQYQTWTNPQYDSFYRGTGQAESKIKDPSDSENWFSRFSETRYPLYHGIDLRFLFTGIEKFMVTLNNNVSYARVKGISAAEADEGKYVLGWGYSDFLGNKADRFYASPINNPNNGDGANRSELYIGLFNALGVRYSISEQLFAEASLASQFGRFSLDWKGAEAVSSTRYLGAYIGATYTIFDIAGISGTVRLGLDLRFSSFNWQNASLTGTMPKNSAGVLEFGIPISMMVQY